jgi:hypothetical protein
MVSEGNGTCLAELTAAGRNPGNCAAFAGLERLV